MNHTDIQNRHITHIFYSLISFFCYWYFIISMFLFFFNDYFICWMSLLTYFLVCFNYFIKFILCYGFSVSICSYLWWLSFCLVFTEVIVSVLFPLSYVYFFIAYSRGLTLDMISFSSDYICFRVLNHDGNMMSWSVVFSAKLLAIFPILLFALSPWLSVDFFNSSPSFSWGYFFWLLCSRSIVISIFFWFVSLFLDCFWFLVSFVSDCSIDIVISFTCF